MLKQKLTQQDVAVLLQDHSADVRADLASKLAQQYDAPDLTESERRLAEDIFRLMVKDAEVRVREALSVNLKESLILPHDVAASLAKDVNSVSLPMLEFSQILTPYDLIEIVRGHDPMLQTAIARRQHLPPDVADALVDEGDSDAVAALVGNDGASLSESTLMKIVDDFGDDERIQAPLVYRPQLPVTVSERLVLSVSEALQTYILKNHELPPDLAADLVMQSRERAIINLSSESSETSVERLVQQMEAHHRLTPSIILRAICMGDLTFFEYALSVRSGVPVSNTRTLVHDAGALGLKAIFNHARLPPSVYPACRAGVDTVREVDYDGGDHDRERYQRRVIERVLTRYGDLGVDFDGADLEYLLARMGQLPSSLSEGEAAW